MADKTYTLDQAIVIAKSCLKAYKQWGQHADYPYMPWQMVLVMEQLLEGGNFDGLSRAEGNKIKAQLNAALAREAKRSGRAAVEYKLGDFPE